MASIDLVFSLDNFLSAVAPTINYDTIDALRVGEETGNSGFISRSIIKPDFSSIPAGQVITAATLKMTPTADLSTNARTMYAHRILRTVVAGQSTWNVYSTGNSWATAGCSDSTSDYDGAVVLGSAAQSAAPTINSALSFQMTLNATEINKFYNGTYTNNGIILFVDTQLNDAIFYASTQHANAAYRPVISATYEPAPTAGGGFFMFF